MKYSLEKDKNGIPVDQNREYEMVKDGSLILSPYSTWKFKLVNTENDQAFNELKKYKDQIDLELIGTGIYVSNEINASDLKMEDYYKNNIILGIEDNKIMKQSINNKKRTISNKTMTISELMIMSDFK